MLESIRQASFGNAVGSIYANILTYKRFLANLLTGSPQTMQELQHAIVTNG